MKTLVRSLLGLTVVLGSALPSSGQVPPPITPILIFADDVNGGCYFYGDTLTLGFGGSMSFSNKDSAAHDVDQREGFWSFSVPGGGQRSAQVHAVGAYVVRCDGDDGTTIAKVKPKAPANPSSPDFEVTWGGPDAANAWTYDVQYRIGTGDWRGWKRGVSVESATFDGRAGKTYFFRGRTTRAGGSTDWSPAKKVTT